MKNYILTALIVLLCHLSVVAQTTISGELGGTTLTKANSPYVISGNITVSQGQTLTIQSGVEIQSHNYTDVINVYGTLIAKGTATDSIRFIGFTNPFVNQYSTHGGSIQFQSGSVNSVLDYAVIDSMGDADYYGEAIGIGTTSFSITNSNIRNSDARGIYVTSAGISPIISQNNFYNNSKDIESIISGVGGITNCKNAKVYLVNSSVDLASQIPKPGVNSYYVLEGGFTVSQGQILTIQAGVEIQSHSYTDVINVYGTLLAKGTVTDSIHFTGFANPAINQYSTSGGSIQFESSSLNSSIQYAVIDSMGDADYYGNAIGIYSGSVSISSSSIRNSDAIGINIAAAGISPVISGTSFLNNPKSIVVYPSSAGGISNCKNASIYISNGSVDVTSQINKPGSNSYYILSGGFIISQGKILTVQPGVEIQSHSYTDYIEVYGTLIAKGTAVDSIKFTGFANPLINQYSTSGGSVQFESSSINSALQYTSFDRMGDADYYGTAIGIYTASLSITNSSIRNSDATGININAQSILPTISQNGFSNNLKDIEVNPDACSGITNNSNTKIYIRSGYININTSWTFPGTNSYYTIEGSVYVNNTYVLTIDAGNLIYFSTGATLNCRGTLRAIGTQTTPIRFLNSNPVSNSANYIQLTNESSNSVLKYIIIDKFASGYYALDIETPSFSLSDVTISNCGYYGLYVGNIGNTQLTSLTLINNFGGLRTGGGFVKVTNSNIYGNSQYGVYNTSSDTVDARNCYWGDTSGPYHPTLNSSGKGNQVSNRVKFNPWNPQPQNGVINDVGVSSILSPVTDCNLTNTDSVKVRIYNSGNVNVSGFQVSYKINNGIALTETVPASILPGNSLDYAFTQTANLSAIGSYQIISYTTLSTDSVKTNDTAKVTIQHLANISASTSLLPTNNSSNLDIPLTLSWSPVESATGYDLYVWKTTDAEPATPLISNLTQVSYTLSSSDISFGTTYKWKVVVKRLSCSAASITQSFTTRQLPDLIVESINVPQQATSETDISISWKIKNQGTGSTGSINWTDLVYFSDQKVLGKGTDYYVGQVSNLSSLDPGKSYQSATITFHVPQGAQGNYYVIVRTNSGGNVKESIDTNDVTVSTAIPVTLAPWPDLQVSSLAVSPSTAFSEDSLTVNFTVINAGAGPTNTPYWNDGIYLSQSETLNIPTAIKLASIEHDTQLPSGQSYTVSAKVGIPARISGTYYLYVMTDLFYLSGLRNTPVGNLVFENNDENNNTKMSQPLTIIQRPTPDLTVADIYLGSDSLSTSQSFSLQWTIKNEGAAVAKPVWTDQVYIATDTINNGTGSNYYVIGSNDNKDSVQSLSSKSTQYSGKLLSYIPEGDYYFYVKTDAKDNIYENPSETNNIAHSVKTVHISNPDLVPSQFTFPVTAVSGSNLTISWRIKNNSRASITNSAWNDHIYLSRDSIFDRYSDVLLTAINIDQIVLPASEYTKQTTVTLSDSLSGKYYLILVTDYEDYVLETDETNNVAIQPITISLTPWADLQVTSIAVPARDTIATLMAIQYTEKNSGTGSITNKRWSDYIYLSPSSTVVDNNLTYVGTVNQNRSLASGQSFTQATNFIIPSYLTGGQYYVVIKTDIENQIFENTGEGNNASLSTAFTLDNTPEIDLSVISGELTGTTVTAGQPVTVQWSVKNNSSYATVIPSWNDAVYLSSNPVLDASDKLLGTVSHSGTLTAGDSYIQTHTFTIPQDAIGTVYLLVTTDPDNSNNDPSRGNNTLPVNLPGGSQQAVDIVVPPPANLTPTAFSASEIGTESQPITVNYTVKNTGAGNTPSAYWQDYIYLSSDYEFGGDILLGSIPHSGTLNAGEQYNVSQQLYLPAGVSGNYVLMIKTDAASQIYEPDNEGDNIAYTNITISLQPPSDLVVSNVTIPAGTQIAGSNITVNWRLTNIGSNAAIGYLREAVYLSLDSTIDANDVLLGTLDDHISLPALGFLDRQLTAPLLNVAVKNYYVIVRTDLQNNIVEQDEDNNITVASSLLQVGVKELPIAVTVGDTLSKASPLYYRIEIPSSLAGETVSVSISGDTTNNAFNRLFIRYDSVPTLNMYDYTGAVPFKANQEAIIPAAIEGTYYLMAVKSDTASQKTPVSLLAKVIPFSITEVEANKGGNTGLVTVKISGAKFDSTTSFSLLTSSANVVPAYKTYYTNGAEAFVTFNLLNKDTGQYNVIAVNSSHDTATLVKGFTVVTGPGSAANASDGSGNGANNGFVCHIVNEGFDDGISTELVSPPGGVRVFQIGKVYVYYENTGTVDIPTPTRYFLSLTNGVPVGLTSDDLSQKYTEVRLDFTEPGGPPDVLRPGASGFITVYIQVPFRGVTGVDFLLTE